MPPNPLSLPCTGGCQCPAAGRRSLCVSDHVTWGVCIHMLGVYPQLSDACVKSIAPQEGSHLLFEEMFHSLRNTRALLHVWPSPPPRPPQGPPKAPPPPLFTLSSPHPHPGLPFAALELCRDWKGMDFVSHPTAVTKLEKPHILK